MHEHELLGRAITFRQPWAWLIASGHKTIENRIWQPTRLPVRLLVHAGKTYDDVRGLHVPRFTPPPADLTYGAVIGEVEVVDVVEGSTSEWAIAGQLHWQLANAIAWDEPVECRGYPGYFDVYRNGVSRPRGR